jgi:hypothetical protein
MPVQCVNVTIHQTIIRQLYRKLINNNMINIIIRGTKNEKP